MEDHKTLKRTLPKILGDFAQSESIQFCAPAHKQTGLGGFFQEQLAKWDIKSPERIQYSDITDSLEITRKSFSDAYGAEYSFFSTGGSASAIQIMVDALDNSDSVLLYNPSNRYADYALKRKGISVYYPKADDSFPSAEDIDKYLIEKNISVVFITSPDIYGFCADLEQISYVVHKHNALLIVDSSFGSHFPFSDELPDTVGVYADMWCHAPYYSLNAMTQAAVIHLNTCRIKKEKVMEVLKYTEDEMQSYILLSSLDWALHLAKIEDWSSHIKTVHRFSESLSEIQGVRLIKKQDVPGAYDKDPFRITIDINEICSGDKIRKLLADRNIYIETAIDSKIVILTGTEDNIVWYPKMIEALTDISKNAQKENKNITLKTRRK